MKKKVILGVVVLIAVYLIQYAGSDMLQMMKEVSEDTPKKEIVFHTIGIFVTFSLGVFGIVVSYTEIFNRDKSNEH